MEQSKALGDAWKQADESRITRVLGDLRSGRKPPTSGDEFRGGGRTSTQRTCGAADGVGTSRASKRLTRSLKGALELATDVDHRLVKPDSHTKSQQRIDVALGFRLIGDGLDDAEDLDAVFAAPPDGLHEL